MPRHATTAAPATGVGAAAAAAQRVRPGKDNLWDPDVVFEPETERPVPAPPEEPSCAAEHLRMVKAMALRRQLRQLRAQRRTARPGDRIRPAVMACERWFMRQQLLAPGPDPVLPAPAEGRADQGFVSDLVTAGDDPGAAKRTVLAMNGLAREAVSALQEARGGGGDGDVAVTTHRHSMDVSLGGGGSGSGGRSKVFKINPAHYEKLRQMFVRASPAGAAFEQERFHRRLYCVLARYHLIQGHGFQAALCEQAFDVMRRRWGVAMECFASPLNCRYARHCSAFADTDACFGSVGSFFQFTPLRGSYECNPPFEPLVLDRAARHCEELLGAAAAGGRALSFAVIVPGWTECEAWRRLTASAHLRDRLLVARGDHGFCDGAAHQRRDRYRESPYDTAVFFLQTDAAARRWPVDAAGLGELRAAMAEGKPTAAMQLRHDKAGRGTDDTARGVYKGKKRNATGEGVMARRQREAEARRGRKRHRKAEA